MAEPDKKGTGNANDMWPHMLTAAIIALAGVVVAFAVVTWSLGINPGERQRQAVVEANRNAVVSLFNGRISTLSNQLKQMAGAPDTISALLSGDRASIDRTQTTLASHLSGARRIALFAKGRAEVDLSSNVPITFAALEVIKSAETSPFSGPEVSVNQRNLFYAAVPITNQGRVVGVLFAVMDQAFFLEPMDSLSSTIGSVTIEQKFQGASATSILSWGSNGLSEHRVSEALIAPHWIVHYDPSPTVLPDLLSIGGLLTPLAMCIIVVLGGIYLAFSRLFRKLGDDLGNLENYARKRIRGRKPQLERYNLSNVQAIAINLSKEDGPAAGSSPEISKQKVKTKPAAPRKTQEEAEELDLSANTSEELLSVDDDFLEVEQPAQTKDDNFGIEVSEDVSPIDSGLALDRAIFRAYDIRGIVDDSFTEDVVYWIGRAFAAQALTQNQAQAVIGRDGRLSSSTLRDALISGLHEGGLDTIDIGEVPTPVLYYATHELNTGTGIMITGSHNPPSYNGLKLMIGGTTLAEGSIQKLYQRIADNDFSEGNGSGEALSIDAPYIERITSDVALAQPVKVVIDCGNGVAGEIAPRLFEELGCEVVPLYCNIDGNFPNHHPDPAEPGNLGDLITVVKAEHADLGIAFDGDGDRLGVVTGSGEIIWPDKLMMLFSQDIVGRNPGADIIYDVKCSRHLNTLISEYGGRPIMWKTGHSHMKAKLKETGALLAGEFSGHICFGERWYGFDDALYAAARLLEIITAESQTADELFAQFPITFSTPELKIDTTEDRKVAVMKALASSADFGEGTLTTVDGLRVDYADGWGLVRASNTSPVLTLRFEADGQSALDRIRTVFAEQLANIDPDLKLP